ncbi:MULTISPECIES: AbrB/MazE/SpoVT family DNA-binding domain-containing protein [unclassified Nitratireductor]|uniref:AbrB/MazE/SpoVT family DNA-binding domain-containing protein n=1 Tax=unclassified Nitratireductor TaxID=2641084 RepID=UPI0024BD61CE|nr:MULTISPECIES: AbrB/MazE/SpoVT family DNA-binding domain-containing protein [unclassified Nitratireductor]MCV0348836.1 AbrB/MazE/SpoVT family DNA-binding domain-containing protein [Nitratireductor sp.]MCV0379240.1 AbrB/MazE/SpoVT family DNA-binding domain-containing protein [Nitratireductor sp.]MDJ1462086.1 AbrB/MazE/SpoVT family DNA-binding domain-containing protein [Nitratireductor sp. GZWM139]
MNVTIRKIGNSEGVILPKEVLERQGLKSGDQLVLTETENGIYLKTADDHFERQLEAAHQIMDQYKVALRKLAE